jgi:hypothetical protein
MALVSPKQRSFSHLLASIDATWRDTHAFASITISINIETFATQKSQLAETLFIFHKQAKFWVKVCGILKNHISVLFCVSLLHLLNEYIKNHIHATLF